MKGLLTGLMLLAGAAQADEAAIRGVIDGQLEAFRSDDVATAFTFAAPGIRDIFRNPQVFGRMVREGYPMVWRNGRIQYLEATGDGSGWRQEVLITDAAGRLHTLAYTMVETPDGWKIAGVEILRDPGVGV
ncbi:DUF4864 domain-containing protein [uncultured Jannaschia sp.]|uniref:DUF4864 domain-containing protein n=1 Tax=uncultured Jannaschia sp. TaxID=293347 RepID=UPI002633A43A|nr:DUF4864 domain-containing protein [uncultured Jannaschia sp.]